MSDRPRTQQALASSLADLVSILPQTTVIPFLRAYWQTMAREWTNIDVLRMEKFLLLTRRYLGATFQVMKKGTWEEESVKVHLELLHHVLMQDLILALPALHNYVVAQLQCRSALKYIH